MKRYLKVFCGALVLCALAVGVSWCKSKTARTYTAAEVATNIVFAVNGGQVGAWGRTDNIIDDSSPIHAYAKANGGVSVIGLKKTDSTGAVTAHAELYQFGSSSQAEAYLTYIKGGTYSQENLVSQRNGDFVLAFIVYGGVPVTDAVQDVDGLLTKFNSLL